MNLTPCVRRAGLASASLVSRPLWAVVFLLVALGLISPAAWAQSAETGTLMGRVLNATNGQYLPRATVEVVGTKLSTLTNEFGEYTLPGVPVGELSIKVSFTGQTPVTVKAEVGAGEYVSKDITLGAERMETGADGAVLLDEFTVATNRFRNAQEIAVNEERNSTNIKDVVSVDQFGYVAGGNLGEFVKFLPGVETVYGDADAFAGAGIGGVNQATASQISVRGFGAADTAITIDGMPVSSISPAGLTRAVGLDMLSVNNASRVEIIKVARPDMPNESAGATVNLVTKSAFEYAKPQVTVSANVVFNTDERGNPLKKQAGPSYEKTFHTLPGGFVSVILPLSSTFGMTVSAASANSYSPNRQISTNWQSTTTTNTRIPTNNPTPTTKVVNLKGDESNLANPFLRQTTFVSNPWTDYKQSGALKADWRALPSLSISASYQASTYTGINVNRRLQFSAEKPLDWGSDYTLGRWYEAATTNPTVASLDPGNKGNMEVTARDRDGFTQNGYLKLDFVKGPWTIKASAGASEAFGAFRDTENDHFAGVALSLANVGKVDLLNIQDGVPGTVNVYDRSRNPIDYSQLSGWTIDNAATLDVKTQRAFQRDKENTYNVSIRRDLDFLPVPVAFEIGGSQRVKQQRKWGLGTGGKIRYTGPTLSAASILDDGYTLGPGFTMSAPQQWADAYKLYKIYQTNPEYFDANYDVSYTIANYRTGISQNKSTKEVTNAAYAMLDGSLFNKRLTYLVGARGTQGEISGYQGTTNQKWNYIQRADGSVYTDDVYTNGVKIDGSTFTTASNQTVRDVILTDTALQARLKAAGISYPDHLILGPGGAVGTTTNSLEATQRQFYRQALRDTKRDNPISPSASFSYKITDSLSFKPAWSRETQMPPLDGGNGGTSGILGGFTVNPNVVQTGDLGGDGSITVSNPGLKPQIINSYNFRLDYYTKNGGSLSGSYYIKDIENQWETSDLYNTSSDYFEVLDNLGLDRASYDNYKISTTINGLEKARQTGYELSFRQNFGIFGSYGRFFNAFGSYSNKTRKESTKANVISLAQSASESWSGGVNFSTSRISISGRIVYVGESLAKSNQISYNGQLVQLYTVSPEEYKVDAEIAYQISKRYSFLISGKNILNSERTRYRRDALGIIPEYSKVSSNNVFGVAVTAQLTAQF